MNNNNVVQFTHYETFSINQIEQIQTLISIAVMNEINRQINGNQQ